MQVYPIHNFNADILILRILRYLIKVISMTANIFLKHLAITEGLR